MPAEEKKATPMSRPAGRPAQLYKVTVNLTGGLFSRLEVSGRDKLEALKKDIKENGYTQIVANGKQEHWYPPLAVQRVVIVKG